MKFLAEIFFDLNLGSSFTDLSPRQGTKLNAAVSTESSCEVLGR